MTSETQLKQQRNQLFSKWQALGERVQLLGTSVESSFGYTSYQDYLKAVELHTNIVNELQALWTDTNAYIQDNYYDRWIKNGEIE